MWRGDALKRLPDAELLARLEALSGGERRLTPWSNDPLLDPQGEALYLRDEETAEVWTPTPQPAGSEAACQVRHRAGMTTWLRTSNGLEQRLTVFVPPDAPVKLAVLRIFNPPFTRECCTSLLSESSSRKYPRRTLGLWECARYITASSWASRFRAASAASSSLQRFSIRSCAK